MSSPGSDNSAAPPIVKRHKGPSVIWLLPFLAALIAGWLVIKSYQDAQNQFDNIHKPIEQSGDWIEGYMEMDLMGSVRESQSEDFYRGAAACVERNNVMEGLGR